MISIGYHFVRSLSKPVILLFHLIFFSFVFSKFPVIDLFVSDLFYDPHTRTFLLDQNLLVKILRKFQYLLYVMIIIWALFALFGKALFFKNIARPDFSLKKIGIAILVTLALVPGATVNLYTKEYWGRPRPHQILHYGGNMPYVKVWVKTHYCLTNCSFVGGESSGAAWLSVFTVLVRRRYFKKTILCVTGFFITISYFRLAAGGHFLSDIIIGAAITFLLNDLILRAVLIRSRSED